MQMRTVTHEVTFSASPREIFEALVDPKKHSAFTGAPAEIDRKPGGRFGLYDGQLTGTIVEIKQDQRLIEDWRASNWPEGHLSRILFVLTPLDSRQTQLSMTQTGVPAMYYDDINLGWQTYYWTRMAAYFRDQKVAVVRKFMEGFKNKANLAVVDEFVTPSFVLHLRGQSLPPGPQSQKAVGKFIFDAFSDVQVTVNDTIVEGDRVVERHTTQAVHSGSFNGIPATGKRVVWTENHIYRLEDGKIAETWSEASFHDLLAQISSSQSVAAGMAS